MSETLATCPSLGEMSGDLKTVNEILWGDGQPGPMLVHRESSGL